MTELSLEFILEIEEITEYKLSHHNSDYSSFDDSRTSFCVSNEITHFLFSHNKHYYCFKTIQEFKEIFENHMYNYYGNNT